jgi:S-adenosylmethionine-diacylglycerol 3-amino-3-carboxypropyl transferase
MTKNPSYLKDIPTDRLLYSNCWEDADLLLQALDPGAEDVILSIGSAGDNSFSLLARQPKKVLVYDVSWPQIYLIQLKKAAFLHLEYEELLRFLGFQEGEDRWDLYQNKLKARLQNAVRLFWNERRDLISQGIIHTGRLEHYFAQYRKWIQPLLASKKQVNRFFSGPPTEKDLASYSKKIARPLFRQLLRFFLSRQMMKRSGRTASFFNEVDLNVSDFLLEQMKAFLLNPESYQNHYIHYISKGHFGNGLPHYVRPENFEAIRSNLHRLTTLHGFCQTALEKERGITLINASDIFEYMPRGEFQRFESALWKQSSSLKRIAYWNLMVDRSFAETWPDKYSLLEETLAQLKGQDRIYFYKRFVLESPIHELS